LFVGEEPSGGHAYPEAGQRRARNAAVLKTDSGKTYEIDHQETT
jgi:hypothetical protein